MTWIKISIVLSILSLLLMFLSYYGILRYFQLRMNSSTRYLEAYKNLPKIGKNKITASFTCSEKDIANIRPFINSILDQSVKIDDISIITSPENIKKIPKDLRKILSIYESPDVSCSLKSAVSRERDVNTKIIVLSPKIIYNKDFIAEMVETSDENPENSICVNRKGQEIATLVKPLFFSNVRDFDSSKNNSECLKNCKKIDLASFGNYLY